MSVIMAIIVIKLVHQEYTPKILSPFKYDFCACDSWIGMVVLQKSD